MSLTTMWVTRSSAVGSFERIILERTVIRCSNETVAVWVIVTGKAQPIAIEFLVGAHME
jgi:hypothetical protein